MIKLISIFLCILFLNQVTFNMWVLIDFYMNQDYISKNKCVNRFDKMSSCKGKCVLVLSFSKYQKETSPISIEKIPNCKKIEIQPFLPHDLGYNFTFNLVEKSNNIKGVNALYMYYYQPFIFHPPKV